VRGNFLALLDAVAAQKTLPFGAVANRRSVLYVANLDDAIAAALDAPQPIAGAHFVADAKPVSTPELIRATALALDEPLRLPRVPLPLLRLLGAVSGRSGQVERLTQSLEVDASSYVRASGWRPAHALAEGLAATASWWRTRHSI
jgi:UDP-glucose 4-epimerase